MILEHYSERGIKSVWATKQPEPVPYGKPQGLWVSVRGDDDWLSWCRSEDFGLDRLKIVQEIFLSDNADICWMTTRQSVKDFHERYAEPFVLGSKMDFICIDWRKVAEKYDGIIIAPYRWEFRLDGEISKWYYGFDCASGCIWNPRAIAEISKPKFLM